MQNRAAIINHHLDRMLNASVDIAGTAVVSADGLLVTSRMNPDVNPDRIGAISATLMGVTNRVVRDLNIGYPREVIIYAEDGYFLVLPMMKSLILALKLRAQANLALALLQVRETSQTIVLALEHATEITL